MSRVIRNSDTMAVSVYYQGDHGFDNATASASFINYWWVDRVFVHPSLRGKGIGKMLVGEMLDLIKKRGGGRVQVCPGGYDMEYEDQRSFYEACGFEEVKPGLMEMTL